MHPRIATYRLQLTPSFGFAEAARLVAPLSSLGVSHLYLSPVASAVPQSSHGYDVVDHSTVREELGGPTGLEHLLDTAHGSHLGIIVDHVPNHVSVAVPALNEPWWAMLRDGRHTGAARWFDVDWEVADDKVVLPVLAEATDDAIEAGHLRLLAGPNGDVLDYHGFQVPVAEGTSRGSIQEVLSSQHYRLTPWRAPERNVRRFFTIDDLVAVRVDQPEVARRVDTLLRELVEHPAFAGVRIDHVDGLVDPAAYLHGVRDVIGDRWLLVEKILAPGEELARDWPVDGTTGYEHIVHADHVLLDPAGEDPLRTLWTNTGASGSFEAVEYASRLEVLAGALAPDLDRVLRTVERCAPDVWRDHERSDWRDAVVELTVALDRYRVYPGSPSAVVDAAAAIATRRKPSLGATIEAFAALVEPDGDVATRWQLLTGPAMAKGAEDRAFYRYGPLGALAEVGGTPGRWTIDVATWHRHQLDIQTRAPTTLTAGTTHDTKRSETVRARALALAASASDWRDDAERASRAHGGEELRVRMVDPRDRLLAEQTAVTAWPLDHERLAAYLVKAAREADLHTSWTDPDEAYEAALDELAASIVAGVEATPDRRARRDSSWAWLRPWVDTITASGGTADLRRLVLQLTAPGVPDLYQGSPAAITSLVDPDNRRPPDWDSWRGLIEHAVQREQSGADDLVATWRGGLADLTRTMVIRRILALRARHRMAFGADGAYTPIDPRPPAEEEPSSSSDLIAFARGHEPIALVVVAPVRSSPAEGIVPLPPGWWRDVLRDDRPLVRDALDTATWWTGPAEGFGVAVLELNEAVNGTTR